MGAHRDGPRARPPGTRRTRPASVARRTALGRARRGAGTAPPVKRQRPESADGEAGAALGKEAGQLGPPATLQAPPPQLLPSADGPAAPTPSAHRPAGTCSGPRGAWCAALARDPWPLRACLLSSTRAPPPSAARPPETANPAPTERAAGAAPGQERGSRARPGSPRAPRPAVPGAASENRTPRRARGPRADGAER